MEPARRLVVLRVVQLGLFILLGAMGILYLSCRFGWCRVPSFLIRRPEGRALARAVDAYQRGDYPQAVADYRRCVALAPLDVEGWYGLAVALGQLGEVEQAYQAAAQAAELQPADRRVRHAVALLQIGRGRPAAAIEIYDRLIKEDKHDQLAWANRAFAYHHWGREEQALRYYRQAIEEFPSSPQLRYSLAMLYYQRRKYPAAIQELQAAVKVHLHYEEAYLLMARCAWAQGDRRAAAEYAEQSKRLAGERNPQVAAEAAQVLSAAASTPRANFP